MPEENPSLEARINQCINSDGSVTITPRVARWLDQQSGMTADRRSILRTTDPDAYVVLAALHLVALRSDCGTGSVARQRSTPQSKMWMSTGEAAKALNVTDRSIRKWCASGRLHAVMSGGRWLVSRNTLNLRDAA